MIFHNLSPCLLLSSAIVESLFLRHEEEMIISNCFGCCLNVHIVYVLAVKEDYSLWMGSGRVIMLMQYWKVLLTLTQTSSTMETIIICIFIVSFIPNYY